MKKNDIIVKLYTNYFITIIVSVFFFTLHLFFHMSVCSSYKFSKSPEEKLLPLELTIES